MSQLPNRMLAIEDMIFVTPDPDAVKSTQGVLMKNSAKLSEMLLNRFAFMETSGLRSCHCVCGADFPAG